MKYKTGYQIDGLNRYIGEIKVRENPRREGHYPCSKSTVFIEPPETKKYESAIWDKGGKKWTLVPDFTGRTFYNKKTAFQYDEVIYLGDVIDLNEWTEEKPDRRYDYQYFNDVSGVWEENIKDRVQAEKEEKIGSIKAQLDALDLKKIRYLVEKDKGDLSGKKYFDEYEAETVRLRDELRVLEEKA